MSILRATLMSRPIRLVLCTLLVIALIWGAYAFGVWLHHKVGVLTVIMWTYGVFAAVVVLGAGLCLNAALEESPWFQRGFNKLKHFSIVRTDTRLGLPMQLGLASLPFVILVSLYLYGAYARHAENEDDRIMPTVSQMVDGIKRVAIEEDQNGDVRLWLDSWATGRRFLIAMCITLLAVPLGVNMGLFPVVKSLLYWFTVCFDKVNAMVLLPMVMILVGIDETSKILLILLGVFPTVALAAHDETVKISAEQIAKGQSLGATEQEICYRIVLPQVWPLMLNTIRLNFKAAMCLLIAAEALAAAEGLGFRIFLLRRYQAMDVIIPYVLWMTLLLFLADYGVQWWVKRYRWIGK